MGLYLCVFASDDSDDDLDGIEVGTYDDFGRLPGRGPSPASKPATDWGARFPTLLQHSDCDGQWTVDECRTLRDELTTIRTALAAVIAGLHGMAGRRGRVRRAVPRTSPNTSSTSTARSGRSIVMSELARKSRSTTAARSRSCNGPPATAGSRAWTNRPARPPTTPISRSSGDGFASSRVRSLLAVVAGSMVAGARLGRVARRTQADPVRDPTAATAE